MAHSGGGGSRRGGVHRGSHSRGSGRRIGRSRTNFQGAYRHRYINRYGREVVYYSTLNKVTRPSIAGAVITFLCLAMFLFVCLIDGFTMPVHIPHKLKNTVPDMQYVVDEADFLTESQEQELNQVLQKFYDKTGVNPCVYLVTTDRWAEQHHRLEDFGFASYYKMFNDETHYLVVYADNPKAGRWNDWAYHTIVGDDTERVLGAFGEDYMVDMLYDSLMKMDLDDALIHSFKKLTKYSGRIHFDLKTILLLAAIVGFSGVIVFWMVKDYRGQVDEYRYSLEHGDVVKNPYESDSN